MSHPPARLIVMARARPVGPAEHVDCCLDDCAESAVLTVGAGHLDAFGVCAEHAATQGRVVDPDGWECGSVILGVYTPPGRAVAELVQLHGSTWVADPRPVHVYVGAEAVLSVNPSASIITIRYPTVAAAWGLRPGTPLTLASILQIDGVYTPPEGL